MNTQNMVNSISAQFEKLKMDIPADAEPMQQTVLSHQPWRGSSGKLIREIWSHFSVQYYTPLGELVLQPSQAAPVWERDATGDFKICAAAQITTRSVMVADGRYMVKGGDQFTNSHPKIKAYEEPGTVQYASGTGSAAIRYPGGLRRLRLTNTTPAVFQDDSEQMDSFHMDVHKLHACVRNMNLDEGCPIRLVAFGDDEIEGASALSMFDVTTQQVCMGWELPLPVILSGKSSDLLGSYVSEDLWQAGIMDYLNKNKIHKVGLLFQEGKKMVKTISKELPTTVYRNAYGKEDIGINTLDFGLQERIERFQTGKYEII